MTNSNASEPNVRTPFLEQVSAIAFARSKLDAPDNASGHTPMDYADKAIEACLRRALDEGITPLNAKNIFFNLPQSYVEFALIGKGCEVVQRVYSVARTDLSSASTILGPSIIKLTPQALRVLKEDGLDYDSLAERMAAELWISRGAEHGEGAFRKKYPKKSPVMAYWEENGLILPKSGLSEEGFALVAEEIKTFNARRATAKFRKNLITKIHWCDWRLFLAILREGEASNEFKMPHVWNRVFSKPMLAEVHKLFGKEGSNHEELQKVKAIQELPSVEDILRAPKEPKPDSIAEIPRSQKA